ncbi:MAG: thioredoxin [Moorea sp. SIOASIH]|uniref:thioredoxin family protein n=1 Tax=Moorena sp. SIOASIH TaxID=2607817 RepID=UPI0013B73B1E|nr:thioredoxin domain-containing protein [Moorena sp. SIOASIH]NEO38266.1 thioredoxin [Moorena sp. SIOASIH]
MSNVITIEEKDFEIEVLKAQQPVLVYFWATWCGPCRLVSPSVDWVAENYSDRLKVIKMEVDQNKDAVAKCKVEGVPALRLFKNGELAQSHEGAISKAKLQSMLDDNL